MFLPQHYLPTHKCLLHSLILKRAKEFFEDFTFLHHFFLHPWPPKGHSVKSRRKVHKQVLANLVEAYGVKAQDEHLIPTPNRWTN